MADTTEPLLQLVDQQTGGNNNTWGDVADANFLKIADKLAAVKTKSVNGGTDALTDDEQRARVLIFTGTLGSDQIITVNDAEGVYKVFNNTTGSFTFTFATDTGSGVLVPQGEWKAFYSDGTDIFHLSEVDYQKIASGEMLIASAVGGTADDLTVTIPATAAALVDGQQMRFKAGSNNTTDVTIDTNTIGAVSALDEDGGELPAGTILANKWYEWIYNTKIGRAHV